MKIFTYLISLLILFGCTEPEPTARPVTGALGFDPADLGTEEQPQDDFFDYVNGKWISRTEIPAEYSRYGSMQILQETIEVQLRELIEAMANMADRPPGSDEQKIVDLYLGFMDEQRAEKLGIGPLADELTRIAALETHDEVIAWFGRALAAGIAGPIDFYVDADAADPDRTLALPLAKWPRAAGPRLLARRFRAARSRS